MDVVTDLDAVVVRSADLRVTGDVARSSRTTPRGSSRMDRLATRLIDVVGAVLLLVFVAPLMLMVAGLIALERSGPVLFRQTRIGLGGQAFKVLKFRTMAADAEQRLIAHLASDPTAAAEWLADHKLRNDPRTTPFGRFLRRSSVDELPQLINVLRGEMSLVGPRPIVVDEVAKYGRHFAAYTSVKPGLTGRWQVNGRNDVPYPRRVRMDAAYARSRCVALDVRILFATVPAVLKRRGSY